VNSVDVLGLKPRVTHLYQDKLEKVFTDIAFEINLEYDVGLTSDDIKECINSELNSISDIDVLDKMLDEVKQELYGENRTLNTEQRLTYMSLVMSLLRTKQKLVGLNSDSDVEKDKDLIKLKDSLEMAGIKFTPATESNEK